MQKEVDGFKGKILDESDLGSFYATEKAQLPTIECPGCGVSLTPLHTLLSEQKCDNCGCEIVLAVKWGSGAE